MDLILVELFLLLVSSKAFIHKFIGFHTLARTLEPFTCKGEVVADRDKDDKAKDYTGIIHVIRSYRIFSRADKKDEGEENPETTAPTNDKREGTEVEGTTLELFT
jgi:hypothetical protein